MFESFFLPKPYTSGHLPEVDGHRVFYHCYSNPKGLPVLVFHGGPGSYSKPKHAKKFNLKRCNVVLFDQRGCGRSQPFGWTENNTLQDICADARRLLKKLDISQAVIAGGSWGAAVALAFAEENPELVAKLVLNSIFLARHRDVEWIAKESQRFYPDLHEVLATPIPPGTDLRNFYAREMISGDDVRVSKATRLYGSFERLIGVLTPSFSDEDPSLEHKKSFGLYMHYDAANYGLSDNQLLLNAKHIASIPTLIVHNRLDMICPVEQAYLLHKALPQSKLIIVPDRGHGSALLDKTLRQELTSFL